MQNIIVSGTDPISNDLAEVIACTLASPHAMKKAQEELDVHVGKDRNVDKSDISNLVYLQAIVKETFRLSTSASSTTVVREALQDCQIDGYHVPAGTHVVVNGWQLHYDPRVWSDPCEIRPERFLTGRHAGVEPGAIIFEYFPFGSGRRSCPGISFSLQIIHLALARVIHGFDLAVPSDAPPLKLAHASSLGSLNSDPIQVLFTPRLSPDLYQ